MNKETKQFIIIGVIIFTLISVLTSCTTKREQEAIKGLPQSYVLYSGRFETINDSIAKMGIFIYEKRGNRYYCVNPTGRN